MDHTQIPLTPKEKAILELYRNPSSSSMGPVVRQSIGYAIGSGVFLYLAIAEHEPRYAVVIYASFLIHMLIRIRKARLLVGVMPRILMRYEAVIGELQQQIESAKKESARNADSLSPTGDNQPPAT